MEMPAIDNMSPACGQALFNYLNQNWAPLMREWAAIRHLPPDALTAQQEDVATRVFLVSEVFCAGWAARTMSAAH